jgi:hypothetical protein
VIPISAVFNCEGGTDDADVKTYGKRGLRRD